VAMRESGTVVGQAAAPNQTHRDAGAQGGE
jgi:hypothetical protein